jgi:hypothetical protein
MEIHMFSLKFDLFFPSLDAAKDAAKSLNAILKAPAPPADPREHKRMLDELRHARERVRLQSVTTAACFCNAALSLWRRSARPS